ncbi:MAG: Arm DNA-binding domain-containing protein [Deltaproteobacteria bacterium]|jgi:hypothetical protein|nr:Arm DNA-binding domain-containing protein [Deltaproteobacteria bacterium]
MPESLDIRLSGFSFGEPHILGSLPAAFDSQEDSRFLLRYRHSRAGGGTVMAVKDMEIQNLKPPEKPMKLYDGGGLFLCLAPSGLKSWRYEYAFLRRRNILTFGTYPEVSQKEARERLVEAKRLLREGTAPRLRGKAALQL